MTTRKVEAVYGRQTPDTVEEHLEWIRSYGSNARKMAGIVLGWKVDLVKVQVGQAEVCEPDDCGARVMHCWCGGQVGHVHFVRDLMICDDGIGVCQPEVTDCCDEPRPGCEVTEHRDTNGEVLVTQCNRGFGCNR